MGKKQTGGLGEREVLKELEKVNVEHRTSNIEL